MSFVLDKLISIANYLKYSSDPNPTTNEDMQEYLKNQNTTLANLISNGGLWQPNTEYAENTIVFSPNMGAGLRAKVKTENGNGGTTGTSEPTWGTEGSIVTDGTLTYTMIPQAGTTVATQAEVEAGTDNTKAVTPVTAKATYVRILQSTTAPTDTTGKTVWLDISATPFVLKVYDTTNKVWISNVSNAVKATSADSADSAASADNAKNADTLNNYKTVGVNATSTNPYIPIVNGMGTLEVGSIIDFHTNTTEDYGCRLTWNGTYLYVQSGNGIVLPSGVIIK